MVCGDSASTSSHLIPKCLLPEQGLKTKDDYNGRLVGAHDVVALTVQSGKGDAGGIGFELMGALGLMQ